MKKYIIVIIIMLYCIIDVVPAKAEEYEKTTAYRYTYEGYENGSYYDGQWTQWELDKPWNFTDSKTNTLSMTNRSNYSTTTITSVDVISSSDGKLYFKGRKVAGSVGDMCLQNVNFDYFYRYPTGTTTVDTNYQVTINFKNPSNIRYNFFNVVIFGINRNDGTFINLATVQYRNNPSTGQYAFGNTYTYAGNDGYNYRGFIIAMDIQCVNGSVPLDDTLYHLWTLESNLDTYTPQVDYSGQLANIDGTLSGILNSITGGFTNISNSITQLPITIANAVKNLFVYDDWQDDIEDIANDIQIPYLQQITLAFADVLEQFQWYQPEHTFTIKIPYGNQYLVNQTYDLQTITNVQIIGQYKLIDLIHVMVKFTSFAYVIALLGKIFAIFGFHYWEYLNPIIQKTGGVDE